MSPLRHCAVPGGVFRYKHIVFYFPPQKTFLDGKGRDRCWSGVSGVTVVRKIKNYYEKWSVPMAFWRPHIYIPSTLFCLLKFRKVLTAKEITFLAGFKYPLFILSSVLRYLFLLNFAADFDEQEKNAMSRNSIANQINKNIIIH